MTKRSLRLLAVSLIAAGSFTTAGHLGAQEPPECLSFDPADWPEPAKPYFMLVVDTSGSMTACTTPPTSYPQECNQNAVGYQLNSCGYVPNRLNDAKCALQQTVQAFGGQVNFGLATYGSFVTNCGSGQCISDCGTPNGGTCLSDYNFNNGCIFNVFPGADDACGNNPACQGGPGLGAPSFPENTWLNGANIVVDMLQDRWWNPPGPASNVDTLLEWFDNDCSNSRELYAAGATPIGGSLRAATQYMRAGWRRWSETNYCPSTAFTSPTFMDALDRECRDVNVLLVTDGDDNCSGQSDAVAAASDLFNNGVTLGGKNWPVRVHVINFAGGNQTNTDQIAAAGGTGSSLFATNEVQLAQQLANIIAGAVQPESCDNGDNNCNGCTDEGFKHYCNQAQTCCPWSNQTQRDQCLADYEATLITNPPDGILEELPCTTAQQQQNPSDWLCYNPGDICDELDNNCQDGADEGQTKCGNPAMCPTTEVCDGQDNDCDLQIDEGNVCLGCTPSPEVCDGCDNDCDGIVDNGGPFSTLACGLPQPPNCAGTRSCQAPQPAPGGPGTCAPGAGYGACSNSPDPEVCDGIDNNCNGAIDEGIPNNPCEPPANPPGLVYSDTNPLSVCQKGNEVCSAGSLICVGGTGPGTVELCNGLDDDCDGFVDAADPDSPVFGVGQQCGSNQGECTPGSTQCVNGALVCQGGVGPQPEVCDGLDNDCDGPQDEGLTDAPANPGCWQVPGTCCTQPQVVGPDLTWCPPNNGFGQVGTCSGVGTLSSPPCNAGTLQCQGQNGWACVGGVLPATEVCDGLDNDCSGTADDHGPFLGEGVACGDPDPPCVQGVTQCSMGSLDCVGDVGPQPEVCDGIDNDCDTLIDENIPNMGACNVPFDVNLYPNSDSNNAPCQPGVLVCNDTTGGVFQCIGGVGPTPEVCDGIDNDCDTLIDEPGTAPDGIDGSANPFPPPNGNIGDMCGQSDGACEPGNYQCVNGLFICAGGVGPVTETCDCEDNDCDGLEDELPGPNEPVLCSPGKDCIKASSHCQCAQPCASTEYPCPPGQVCEQVIVQGSGGVMGAYCITDFEAACGDCEEKTVTDADNNVLCAPLGTDPPGCLDTPVCDCKGMSGCQQPCFNVTCSSPQLCSNFGPTPGQCVDDICYQTGCPGCNVGCHDGACVPNPCQPGSCPPNQTAKPSSDWSTCECVPSCADVSCPSGQKCVDGGCVDWCVPECSGAQVCDPSTLTCVDSQCSDDSCPDGAYCDPLTGECGDYPCEGVLCPEEQACIDGDCFDDDMGSGGGGTGGDGAGGEPSSSGAGNQDDQKGVFGLPTGGGGCACRTTGRGDGQAAWLLLLGLAGIAATRRRRRGAGR